MFCCVISNWTFSWALKVKLNVADAEFLLIFGCLELLLYIGLAVVQPLPNLRYQKRLGNECVVERWIK